MTEFARGLLLVITVIFVATPAPIQLIMLLTVGVCIGTLMRDSVMVRRAHVLEQLDGITDIVADKTGTLTMNKMRVKAALIRGKTYQGKDVEQIEGFAGFEEVIDNLLMNSNGKYDFDQKKFVGGGMTDIALTDFLDTCKINFEDKLKKAQESIELSIPFTSRRKRTITAIKKSNGDVRVLVKGASELILFACAKLVSDTGAKVDLDESNRGQIQQTIQDFAEKAMRTVAIGYNDFSVEQWEKMKSENGNFEDLD